MKVYKNKGITYSNLIVDCLANYEIKDVYGMAIDTFYNCREQGYKITIHDEDGFRTILTVWTYAQRNSDKPAITWKKGSLTSNVYDEESWEQRTEEFNNPIDAAIRIADLIKENLK